MPPKNKKVNRDQGWQAHSVSQADSRMGLSLTGILQQDNKPKAEKVKVDKVSKQGMPMPGDLA